MKSRRCWAVGAAASVLFGASAAFAQMAPLASRDLPMVMDSGLVQNQQGLFGAGAEPVVVYSNEVRVMGASWLRLTFDDVLLSGHPSLGNGSYLILTSLADGAHQRLDVSSLKDWSNTSAYLNGDAVLVQLYAYPGTGPNRLMMSEVAAGDPVGMGPPETICGPTDNRTLSTFPANARILPMGCTGWLITSGTCANRFLTAGHCFIPAPASAVVQFNVPLSTGTGGLVNPPPEHQYPVVMASVQAVQTVIGNDYAQFFTAMNSNTGRHAREVQGGAAYSTTSAPAPAGQTLRVTGYGTTHPNDPTTGGGLPLTQTQVQKTHTGLYTDLTGTRIEYQVDTTGGNSGSPVVNGTDPQSVSFGIHTNAGCDNPVGTTANSGTAMQNAGLQAILAAPLGPCAPYDPPTCLTTLFASDNSGVNGGAVYFDVTVGAAPLEVHSLWTNVDAAVGTSFSMDIYTTPDTAVGKETNAGAWTKVAEGNGVADSAAEGATLVALENRFILQPFRRYGIALVLNAASGHDYTNGTGANQQYSNTDLTIDTGSASNTPFGANLSPRVWNGRLCYETLPTNGHCLTTLFASNNFGNDGGTVFFDVDVLPGSPITVSALRLSSGAAAGTALDITVYRHAGTHVSNELQPAEWTQVAHGTGVSAGLDLPSIITLDSWFNLSANSSQGIAIVIDAAGAPLEGHRYTNGTGSNEVYFDGKVRITGGAATNAAFGPSTFSPRVWNGSLCYAVGLTGCTNTQFEQSLPNPSLDARNSNAAAGISTQQVADDFTIASGAAINRITLWGVYTGNNLAPSVQDFTINIYNNVSNNPGAVVYTTNVSVTAQDTGLIQTGFTPDRPLFQFDITLAPAFNAAPGTKYWLSPLGTTPDRTWSWQFFETGGDRRSRATGAGAWSTFTGNMAFEVCGSELCYPDCNLSGTLTVADFGCFQTAFVAGNMYADCNGSGTLTVADFGCFQTAFVTGCP